MRLKVHPSIKHGHSILAKVATKTQKSLEEWKAIISTEGLGDAGSAKTWLKDNYEIGKTTLGTIVNWAFDENPNNFDPDQYLADAPQIVDAQYHGKRERIRPILNKIIEAAEALGEDVGASPCKKFVPLYRHHAFAQIKPTGLKRIDLGLALKGYEGDMPAFIFDTGEREGITHRIPLYSIEDITDEVKDWLKIAYDLDEKAPVK